jgi:hypothetical protein
MLTNTGLRKLKPKAKLYRVADAAGLCIEVQSNGALYWRYRFRFAGKRKMLSLGVCPDVSLLKARERREETRKILAAGFDPSAQRKQDKFTVHLAAANTFQEIAREWLAGRGEPAEATRQKLEWMLESLAFPWIGARPDSERFLDSAKFCPLLAATVVSLYSRASNKVAHLAALAA